MSTQKAKVQISWRRPFTESSWLGMGSWLGMIDVRLRFTPPIAALEA